MNGRVCKKLRNLIGDVGVPTLKRIYRRAKKQYTKTPSDQKASWMKEFESKIKQN
jgi:hypothetical protein